MSGLGRRGQAPPPQGRRLVILAALLAALPAAACAAEAALALPQAWAQEYAETRHGRLAVEEPVYVMEAHMPVTVRITGQVFAESDERRQVVVVVTLPDSSRSEQYTTAARSGHFAVPYQLDKPFPTGADSRPGRYAVSASHGGAALGTVYFEVVRPPQVPAPLPAAGEAGGGAPGAAGGVTGLTASVSRPIYSPDAAVTVHGTAEGAGAGVRLRIDVAGPSSGVVYSGALTTSSAGTYSATIMAPDGRWGGDGEYTAVVTGAGQLARAPFWIESGGGGGAPPAADVAPAREEEVEVEVAPAEPGRPEAPADPAQGGGRGQQEAATPQDAAQGEAGQGGGRGQQEASAPQDAAQGEAAGRNADAEEDPDTTVVLVMVAVAAAAVSGIAAAVVVRKVQKSGKSERGAEGRAPVARRPAAPGPAAPRPERRPAAPGPAAPRPAPPSGPPPRAGQGQAAPRRRASGGMRLVLDMGVVINHKKRSEDTLENTGFYGPQLEYVDSHKDNLLLPERDRLWSGTRAYASSMLSPFKKVYGYEQHEVALERLKGELVANPLSDESVKWIARKFKWASTSGGGAEARIGAVLDRIGGPEGEEGGRPGGRVAREAIAKYGSTEEGRNDLVDLLRRLVSEASQDLQILAIAMRESEKRPSILLTTDYDLFAFPIWRGPLDESKCGPVTMVLGPADARWVVSMRDGSIRVFGDKGRVRGLYSDDDYMEVRRALQYSIPSG